MAENAAKSLDITTKLIAVTASSDLRVGFQQALAAILVMADPATFDRRREIIELGVANKIPTFHAFLDEVVDGAIAAYGFRLSSEYGRSAAYVAKILSGVAVSDLPIDQTMTYEFAINLKTAKAIGFNFPPAVIALANEVIE